MNKIKVIIEKSSTGFAAYIPSLTGCVATGETMDELKVNLEDSVLYHLQGIQEDGGSAPVEFSSDYVFRFAFDVETFLSHYHHIFTRRALSRITGINESLLSQYATGLKRPGKGQLRKIEEGLHRLANELLQVTL